MASRVQWAKDVTYSASTDFESAGTAAAIGQTRETADGKTFRYVKNGDAGTLAKGNFNVSESVSESSGFKLAFKALRAMGDRARAGSV